MIRQENDTEAGIGLRIARDRVAVWAPAVGLALSLASCTTSRMVAVPPAASVRDSTQRDAALQLHRNYSISGYETTDGRNHKWNGFVRPEVDSLHLAIPAYHPRGLELDRPAVYRTEPRDSVRSLSVTHTDPWRSGALVGVIGAGSFVAIAAAELSSMEMYPI